jgi:hypothetical protein
MASHGAEGFWSYTHDDDRADGGRIRRLADKLKTEFGMLTGGKDLRLFVDRDELLWGEDWENRIEEALQRLTFFIPVITPRFFQSEDCRRELLKFVGYAKSLGVEQLLMPILYVDVPEIDDEDPSDEAVALVKRMQRADFRQLRLRDEDSEDYRTAVHELAERLAQIAAAPPIPGAERAPEPREEAEEPGFLDLLARGEEALPKWLETIEELGGVIGEVGRIAEESGTKVNRPDIVRRGFAGRLQVFREYAEEVAQPARRVLVLGQSYASQLVQIDPAILTLLRQAEEDPSQFGDPDSEAHKFFSSVETLGGASREAVGSLKDMVRQIEEIEKISSEARGPHGEIREGLRGVIDGQALIDEWGRRAGQLWYDE